MVQEMTILKPVMLIFASRILLCGQSETIISIGDSGIVFSQPRGWNVINESQGGVIIGNFKPKERVKALIAPWGKAALFADRMPDEVGTMKQWVAAFTGRAATSERVERQVVSSDGTAITVLSFNSRLQYSSVTVSYYFFERCGRPLSFALWLRDGVSVGDAEVLRSLTVESIRSVRCKR